MMPGNRRYTMNRTLMMRTLDSETVLIPTDKSRDRAFFGSSRLLTREMRGDETLS